MAKVNKVDYDHRGFVTPFGLCHFLICTRDNVGKNLEKSFPDAKWPVKSGVYSIKSVYCLEDGNSSTPFVKLNEISIGKEDQGYLSFDFAPFPFSPN